MRFVRSHFFKGTESHKSLQPDMALLTKALVVVNRRRGPTEPSRAGAEHTSWPCGLCDHFSLRDMKAHKPVHPAMALLTKALLALIGAGAQMSQAGQEQSPPAGHAICAVTFL